MRVWGMTISVVLAAACGSGEITTRTTGAGGHATARPGVSGGAAGSSPDGSGGVAGGFDTAGAPAAASAGAPAEASAGAPAEAAVEPDADLDAAIDDEPATAPDADLDASDAAAVLPAECIGDAGAPTVDGGKCYAGLIGTQRTRCFATMEAACACIGCPLYACGYRIPIPICEIKKAIAAKQKKDGAADGESDADTDGGCVSYPLVQCNPLALGGDAGTDADADASD